MSRKITEIIFGIEGLLRAGNLAADPVITGMTEDSREVKPGFLFAAIRGAKFDGTQFIDTAIKAGAGAILTEPGVVVKADVAVLTHKNPREVLGRLAARFYRNTFDKIAAVTGTNGKTSTVHFCRQLWHLVGIPSASMGTLGVMRDLNTNVIETKASMTTPPSVFLHQTLQQLSLSGITHLAMEASSIGLDQSRMAGLKISIAAFTNFTRDHLDYHHTEAEYFKAKMLLFNSVLHEGGVAVINADIPEYKAIFDLCTARGHRVIDFGTNAKEIRLLKLQPKPTGQEVTFRMHGKEYVILSPLVGAFQISNLLCAAGVMVASGIEVSKIARAMEKVTAVPGRLDKAGEHSNGAAIYIDYAHTPDALDKVIRALRPHVGVGGKLWVLFGCGGDRDKGKRPEMGKIACALADKVVVTDDNPRTENAATIRAEILAGCDGKAMQIEGREVAMKHAISGLAKGDILLLAGKGHETYQIIGSNTLPFNEGEITTKLLREVL